MFQTQQETALSAQLMLPLLWAEGWTGGSAEVPFLLGYAVLTTWVAHLRHIHTCCPGAGGDTVPGVGLWSVGYRVCGSSKVTHREEYGPPLWRKQRDVSADPGTSQDWEPQGALGTVYLWTLNFSAGSFSPYLICGRRLAQAAGRWLRVWISAVNYLQQHLSSECYGSKLVQKEQLHYILYLHMLNHLIHQCRLKELE